MTDVASELLDRSLESGRIHSGYLISGPPEFGREVALRFARGVVDSEDIPLSISREKSQNKQILDKDSLGA